MRRIDLRSRGVWLLLFPFLLVSSVACPQVALNTGSIYGKIFNQAGSPLGGVTITLEAAGARRKTVVTEAGGAYLFSTLAPATYVLNFSKEGFAEVRQENITINSGSAAEIEVTLKQSFREKVVVRSDTPLIDSRRTSTTSQYNQQYLTMIPSSRDPWSIVDQTPGIDEDRINVGGIYSAQQPNFIALGGTVSQNTYSLDGMDVTPATGGTPAYVDYGSFDEIVVTTGALDPAISNSGVVISFVTKRGGNQWAGQLNGYYTGDAFQTDNVDDELRAKHFKRPAIIDEAFNFGGDLGGPIVKNKLSIWGAYRYEKIINRTPQVILHDSGSEILDGSINGGDPVTYELANYNLKLNAAYSSTQDATFQLYQSQKKAFNRRTFNLSSGPVTTVNQDGVSRFFKAEHTWSPSSSWFLNAQFAYLPGNWGLEPVAGRNAPPVFRLNGDAFIEGGSFWVHRDEPQKNITFDGNHFVQQTLGGDHELKFGFAYKDSTLTAISQYGGDMILYDYAGHRGDRSLGWGIAKLIYQTTESIHHQKFGAYVADTLRLSRLTLNLGTRFVLSTVKNNPASAPANKVAPDLFPALNFEAKSPAVTFRNLSPRLGATFDVTGSGKTIVRSNYARFYDSADLFYGTFQSPIGHEDFVYTGLYMYYSDTNGDGVITRNELLDQYGLYPFRGMVPGDAQATADRFATYHFVDPQLKAQTTDEYLLGFEREVFHDFSIGLTYTRRKYDRIQDTYIPGVTAADYICEPRTITNPQTGQTFIAQDCFLPPDIPNRDSSVLLTTKGRTRSYEGLEFLINKRMSDRWMLRFSGTYQSQKIHYANNGNTFGGSFQNPIIIGVTDGQWWASDSTGNLGSDWSWKASGAYVLPFDITVGVYSKFQHGYVVPIIGGGRFLFAFAEGQHRQIVAPPDTVRLPNVVYTDMQIEKELALRDHGSLHLAVTIFNLFNINTIQRMNGRVSSFQFLEPQQIVNPRVFRLGLRYTF